MRALIVLLALAAPVAAEVPCAKAIQLEDFAVDGHAILSPGAQCGSFVGSTDGAGTAFSYGKFTFRKVVTLPYEVSLTWRRLDGARQRSLELNLPSAALLVRDEAWGIYTTEAQWDVDGWHTNIPGHRIVQPHSIVVRHTIESIEVIIDGISVGRTKAPPTTSGEISIALKGTRGVRGQMWFSNFSINSLR